MTTYEEKTDKHGRVYFESRHLDLTSVRATQRADGLWWGTKRWLRLDETRQTERGYTTPIDALRQAGRLRSAIAEKAI